MKVGSVCSGIEAASMALNPIGFDVIWVSEIDEFPSNVIKHHYPNIDNHGDMLTLPEKIASGLVEVPDMLCGGTPCQSFSMAGWRKGLIDERGLLTLKFIEIANAIDKVRESLGKDKALVLWENVEGVLSDKTNVFGNFISALAGCDDAIEYKDRWPSAGVLFGPQRIISWRVLDARFFGLPQQRRRLFVLASGHETKLSHKMLFELIGYDQMQMLPQTGLIRKSKKTVCADSEIVDLFSFDNCENPVPASLRGIKSGQKFEFFREYTDCLYSAYGTKWNGNAAAYNGSLFVLQNERLRRFTPLECERLMGFPSNYTKLPAAKDTSRYRAIGNSWAVPVIRWIGERILKKYSEQEHRLMDDIFDSLLAHPQYEDHKSKLILLDPIPKTLRQGHLINSRSAPNEFKNGELLDIVDPDAAHKFYLSIKGVAGILRRKNSANIRMSERLEQVMKAYVE